MKYMTMDQIATVLTQKDTRTFGQHTPFVITSCDIYDITDTNEILAKLQKVNYNNPGFKKLVSQLKRALTEKTPEAEDFLKSFSLFVRAFNSQLDISQINKTWKELFNKLHDEKARYDAIKAFQNWNIGNDYFEETIVMDLCVQNPYATANDILWYCVYNNEPLNSVLFKRGLQKFDQEFAEEVKKDKPDFHKSDNVFRVIYENYIHDDPFGDPIDRYSDEFVQFVSKYSKPALEMRIRIAMLEKENKKLKTDLRAKKTHGLNNGIKRITTIKDAQKVVLKSKQR